ncbi:MAG: enoyl-CoA hydratase/isomerase family protein [Peptostreptococcaceae bacterium]|nr:enoyl-CoA hydratase/isomerase family protein [Peptostreptococcaceae bacterium]
MSNSNIILEINEGIAFITINRPRALNALNEALLDELIEVFINVKKNIEVKAIILTGKGKAFVSGADIAEMNELNPVEGRALMMKGHSVMNLIESMEKPVIAAINGFTLGGGCELAMACDIRISSEKAKFGQPEVKLGIIPGFGGTQRLSRLVGKGMAKYLIMTAEIISADEALRIGLVERVVPAEELMGNAIKVAKTIMSNAPYAVAVAKSVINNGISLDMKSACTLEVESFTAPFSSDDKKEGMSAFLEKRTPRFTNK